MHGDDFIFAPANTNEMCFAGLLAQYNLLNLRAEAGTLFRRIVWTIIYRLNQLLNKPCRRYCIGLRAAQWILSLNLFSAREKLQGLLRRKQLIHGLHHLYARNQ
jgi:hypothetical protein